MRVIGLDRPGDAIERNRSVGFVVQRLRLNAAENRRAALLIFVGVRFLPDQVLIAPAAMRHQGGQIALSSRGEKQRALESEPLGHAALQPIHRRIVAIHIVAHVGRRHGCAHGRRRARHGVAAKIDAAADWVGGISHDPKDNPTNKR